MSRIQDILSKAERDGTARRTRALTDEYLSQPPAEESRPRPSADEAIHARAFVDGPPALRPPTPAPPRVPSVADAHRAASRTSEPEWPVRPLRHESSSAAAPATFELPPSARTGKGQSRSGRPHDEANGPHEVTETVSATYAVPDRTGAPRVETIDHHLVAALAPTSLAAEQYRSLRTRLKQAENGRALRTIAITSPGKGDGKSLTAANLALTMAQEFQQRVLLLDADLRRPSVHTLFGLKDTPGIVDVLMDAAELDQALVFLPELHLTVLPAGIPPTRPAELLGSATMRRVLDTLRTRFDRILIDVPPVAPLADLHVLAPMLDGLLMIVRAGVTPKPAIERALSGLDASKVLGLVLNEAGSEAAEAYNYEGYGYIAG